jgi:RND family efflux transporter MFP subunit
VVEDPDENQIVPVAAQPAEVGSLRATIHASGRVVPADGAEFLAIAPEPARVVEVTRNEGEPVTAGDLLVRFELPFATQELSRQQADMARAQAQLENVRATRDRVVDFVERGLVARNDLNQADRDLADAQTDVTASASALKRAQDTLARATIRAPFAGIVANRLHNPGDVATGSPGDPVLRIVDPTRLEILAAIPGADGSRILPGAAARIAGFVDGQAVTLSVVGRPGGTPDAEGNLHVRLTFASPTALTADAAVDVDIDAEERLRVVFVPAVALVATGKDAALFVAVSDIAQRRAVTTGVTTELGVEITSGLKAGELVITRGQASVIDGTRISVETVSQPTR